MKKKLIGIGLSLMLLTAICVGCGTTNAQENLSVDQDGANQTNHVKNPPHFNRVGLGEDEAKIVYRNGNYNDKETNKDGSVVISYTGLGAAHQLDEKTGSQTLIDEGSDVKFYLNSPEAKKQEDMSGIYKIAVTKGDDEILLYYDLSPGATLEEIKVKAGEAYTCVVDGANPNLQTLYYQLKDIEGQVEPNHYLYFVLDTSKMVEHGLVAKYDLKS